MLLVACKLLLLVFFNILCLQTSYVIMWLNVSDIVKWWAAGTQVFIFVRRTRFQTHAVLPSGPSPGFRSRGAKKSQGVTFLTILDVCRNRGSNHEMGDREPLAPHWRRRCLQCSLYFFSYMPRRAKTILGFVQNVTADHKKSFRVFVRPERVSKTLLKR